MNPTPEDKGENTTPDQVAPVNQGAINANQVQNKPTDNEMPSEPVEDPRPADQEAPSVDSIANRFSEETEKEVERDDTLPKANKPMLVDLANLKPEQLSSLKAMLNVTPDKAQQKKGNIRVTIRKSVVEDVDRYIVDFKRARTAMAYDAETGREFESHKIEVLFNGDEKYTDMVYTDFMDLERVSVEVISQREVENMKEEGEVTQAETGRLVTKEVREVTYYYTLALPSGDNVEVEGKLVNA